MTRSLTLFMVCSTCLMAFTTTTSGAAAPSWEHEEDNLNKAEEFGRMAVHPSKMRVRRMTQPDLLLFRDLVEEDSPSRFSMSMNNDDRLVPTASPSSANLTNLPSNDTLTVVTSRPDETNGDSSLPRNESFASATTAGIAIASVVVVAGTISAILAVGRTLRVGDVENRDSNYEAAEDLSECNDWQYRSLNNMSSRALAACRPTMRV